MNHSPPRGERGRRRMRAYQHTNSMLGWWRHFGVDRADLAVKQPSGAMIWHHDLDTRSLPLAWAGAQNVRQAEVYIRPARGYTWPVVFLDDVSAKRARGVANKYNALVVETSPDGGCHIWLTCEPLTEPSRHKAQRWLAQRIGADLGSTSGEHLGRLAGFKNWKRHGTWVNSLVASLHCRRWDPDVVPSLCAGEQGPPALRGCRQQSTDTSPSGKEWGWVCGMLEEGCSPDFVYERLLERAQARRRSDAPRYARRTLSNAMERLDHKDMHPEEVKMVRF